MSRDEIVKNLRPSLDIDNRNKKSLELFQNLTLRPILKFQQELTFALLSNHQNYNVRQFENTTKQECKAILENYIQSNIDLRNHILGVIISLFTLQEFEQYIRNRKELNKRIIQMQLQRFVDTLQKKYFEA